VVLLVGAPISSVLNDFEQRKRSLAEDDIKEDEELLIPVVVTDGETSFAKMVEVQVFFEGIA
jgi:methionine synthase II (cobalamin-independent)